MALEVKSVLFSFVARASLIYNKMELSHLGVIINNIMTKLIRPLLARNGIVVHELSIDSNFNFSSNIGEIVNEIDRIIRLFPPLRCSDVEAHEIKSCLSPMDLVFMTSNEWNRPAVTWI